MRSLGAVPAPCVVRSERELVACGYDDPSRWICRRSILGGEMDSAMRLFMQEAYGLSNMPAEVAPAPKLAHRPVEAASRHGQQAGLAGYTYDEHTSPPE